jgi:monoamine oxidase
VFTRRQALLGALPLAACQPSPVQLDVQWQGVDPSRAHRLRQPMPSGSAQRREADVIVLGAGVAGLTCARQLQAAGRHVALLELDDATGGNSRSGVLGGWPCPLGAHYLPQPSSQLPELQDLLVDLGAAQRVLGRWQARAEHEVHAPSERHFLGQSWHPGLLPYVPDAPDAPDDAAHAQRQRFARAVHAAQRELGFSIPTARADFHAGHQALDAQTFDHWLDQQGLTEPMLRWYLDYCCRDDYGAGSKAVSAWAGLHYFASRHGFQHDEGDPAPPQLTWPDGNGWLAKRMAEPLQGITHLGRVALQLDEERQGVRLRCWTPHGLEDWYAAYIVLATPLFVAQRIWRQSSPALQAVQLTRAPWLVANLLLREALLERQGAPAAWDNVIVQSPTLGYVNARHQSLDPRPGPHVLTLYWALPSHERTALLGLSATDWAARVLATLKPTHPDIERSTQTLHLTRWGHAMAVPLPGVRQQVAVGALFALRQTQGRVRFAHADLAGYSVFEEAFYAGLQASQNLLRF